MKEETMALNTAIRHLTHGDWQKAHAIVQNDESDLGYWAHGIVHMLEGDIGNARYWYRRAGRPFPRERDPNAEIDALLAALKARTAEAARETSSKPADDVATPSQPVRKAARTAASQAHQQIASPRTTTKQHR
jgi:hypothetical protein